MARELEHGLNERQMHFCENYLTNNLNATQAAIDAGYSKKTAGSLSSRMLQDVKIKAYLDMHRDRTAKKFEITHDKITEKLASIAFSNLGDLVEKNMEGQVSLSDEADFDMLDNISFSESNSISMNGSSHSKSFSIKRSDRLKALDMLSKHLGYYERQQGSNRDNWKTKTAGILSALQSLRKKDSTEQESE